MTEQPGPSLTFISHVPEGAGKVVSMVVHQGNLVLACEHGVFIESVPGEGMFEPMLFQATTPP